MVGLGVVFAPLVCAFVVWVGQTAGVEGDVVFLAGSVCTVLSLVCGVLEGTIESATKDVREELRRAQDRT